MTKHTKMRLRYFEQSPNQRHIKASDHYTYLPPVATHRIAVIGCGTIGQEHMRVAALLGRAQVHGVYDQESHSVKIALDNFAALIDDMHGDDTSGHVAPIVYSSIQAACNDPQIDALIICTPNFTHLEVLKQVLPSGKAILLEKPMATTLEDAAEIVKLAQNYTAPFHVGLQYRFKAIYREATHEILERQSLGEIKTLLLYEHRPPFLDKVKQWNKFSHCTGGTLIEKCCHYFDLMNHYACSAPKRVYASGSQAVNFLDFEYSGQDADIMDNASVIVEYQSGLRATFELNMFAPNFVEELIVCGTLGRLTARERFDVFQTQQSKSTLHIEHAEQNAARQTDIAYPTFIEQSGHHGATYFEHTAFMDRLDGNDSAIATVEQGFWSIVVGAAAEESARTGQVVEVTNLLEERGLSAIAPDHFKS